MRRGSRLRYVHHTRSLPARMGTQLRRYTLAVEYARQGKDWETELRQRAKEVTLMKELGLNDSDTAPDPEQGRGADEEKGKEDSSD